MPRHKSGPKRGQRVATNARSQALRRFPTKKKTSASNQGGASVGGGA